MSNTAETLRIIIVFRSDLPEMTRAKGEVQAGHAVASVIYQSMLTNPDIVKQYMETNQTKLCMEVSTLDDLMKIKEKAEKRGVVYSLIKDAAHTCFSEPTITCIGLGPLSRPDGNNVTRDAKMRN